MAWYVLRARHRQEKLLLASLSEKGIMAYCPLETRWAIHATRKTPKTLVLFPGYVFAILSDDAAIDAARAIRSMHDIMCDREGRPLRISNSGLRGIFLAELFHLFDETYTPPKIKGRRYSHRWKSGDWVQINKGAFEGFVGQVLQAKGKSRMDIMIEVFGRQQSVNVPHADLIAPMQQDVASRKAA